VSSLTKKTGGTGKFSGATGTFTSVANGQTLVSDPAGYGFGWFEATPPERSQRHNNSVCSIVSKKGSVPQGFEPFHLHLTSPVKEIERRAGCVGQ